MAILNQVDYARGKQALVIFHNEMLSLYGRSVYPFTYEQLEANYSKVNKYFVDGLGLGIINSEASWSQVQSGMKTLARKGGGNIPANNNAFTQAIANDVRDNISYVRATVYVAVETTKTVATATLATAENLGNSIIEAGNIANFAVKFWWVTIPLAGFIYYKWLTVYAKRL